MGEYEDMFGRCSWCSQVLSLLMLTENRELPKKKKKLKTLCKIEESDKKTDFISLVGYTFSTIQEQQ